MAVLTLTTVGLVAFVLQPVVIHAQPPTARAAVVQGTPTGPAGPPLPPLAAALQNEIGAALQAAEWPQLTPPMDQAINGPMAPEDVVKCATLRPPVEGECNWGSPDAPLRIVVVGDSIAINYTGPLRQYALASNGRVQLHMEAMGGCQFSEVPIKNQIPENNAACPARKQHAVDYINATKPGLVIVSNSYGEKVNLDTGAAVGVNAWGASMQQIVGKFRPSAGKVVWLSSPPADKNIAECYGLKSSTPADCISIRQRQWDAMAATERDVAKAMGGVWIDASPWFCDPQGLCPAFAGSTPTKRDTPHMTLAYGEKIQPVMIEAFTAAGVF